MKNWNNSLPSEKKQNKTTMNNLVLRTLTGVLFVAALVGGTVYSPVTFTALFGLITALTLWEFTGIVNNHAGANVNRLITTAAGTYLFFAFAGFCGDFTPSRAFVPYLLSLMYLLIEELYLQHKDPLRNWAFAFAAQVYIALGFAMLNVLAFRYDAVTGQTAFEWIFPLSVFIFLWTSDTGAYCCGSLLSRYFPAKLFERVSPKKSWVGSIGGGLLCIAAAVVINALCPGKMELVYWIGLALTVCVFGTWGDLVESLLKRQLGIKDSGNILPGHGGMLDRFDSALLAIPAAVLYFFCIGC